jgi:UDP-hydrolysing UDP-N-acetyl-D-glucosamine 2-epimerase
MSCPRRIAVFTSTRAEYGLLRPLMSEIAKRRGLTLQVIVSGTHLSPAHGMTIRDIENDGFAIDACVYMDLGADTAVSVAHSAALALVGMAEALDRLRPELLVLLGDRYELLAAAQAAVLSRIPIAHIHGGETTEGLIDEAIRHAVTKLSHLHFTAAQEYAQRVCQMGESKDHVWMVGAIALDNIEALQPVSREELEQVLGIRLKSPSLLVTFHPETLSSDSGLSAMEALLLALDDIDGSIVITGTNADPGASCIRKALRAFAERHPGRVALVESLGARRYLSLMKLVDAVVGNSSSGLIEAPAIGKPTVDIGERQQGRLRAPSVIHCEASTEKIRAAIQKALSFDHKALAERRETPYGTAGAARRIADVLQAEPLDGLLVKQFRNVPMGNT